METTIQANELRRKKKGKIKILLHVSRLRFVDDNTSTICPSAVTANAAPNEVIRTAVDDETVKQ
jgi:hypothetical protein